MKPIHSKGDILFRKPVLSDGAAVHDLIRRSPPLDLNSAYAYFLLCEHFADTSMVCLDAEGVIGFISAYFPPGRRDTLFVWQVAVDARQRGKRLAPMMLASLLARPECRHVRFLETTITPDNRASNRLFERFAADHGADIDSEAFIAGEQLGAGHPSEMLRRVGPLDAPLAKAS